MVFGHRLRQRKIRKWSIVAKANNIFNCYAKTRSTIANQDYAMCVWMNYASYR